MVKDKSKLKITKIIFVSLKVAAIIVVAIVLLAFVFGGREFFGFLCKGLTAPRPPKPKIKYAEFPFTLVYKIDGEEYTISDVITYKYRGVEWSGDFVIGYNRWEQKLKSGNKRIVLLEINDITVYYPTSDSASYYMGGKGREIVFTGDAAITDKNTNENYIEPISADDLLNKYGIKLISWEIAPPIKNIYR